MWPDLSHSAGVTTSAPLPILDMSHSQSLARGKDLVERPKAALRLPTASLQEVQPLARTPCTGGWGTSGSQGRLLATDSGLMPLTGHSDAPLRGGLWRSREICILGHSSSHEGHTECVNYLVLISPDLKIHRTAGQCNTSG